VIFARPSLLIASGILFFGFLLLIATLTTRRQRPHLLLSKGLWLAVAAGAPAYEFGGPVFMATLYLTAAINYGIARRVSAALGRRERGAARAWLASGVAGNAGALAWMKLAPVFSYSAGAIAVGARDGFLETRTLMPVGLSFLTFHGISYLADVYRGRGSAQHNAGETATYLLLLPQFAAGPVSYHGVSPQLSRRAVGMSDFAFGVRRIVIGAGKRILIAQPCAIAANTIFGWRAGDLSARAAWLALACFAMQIYFTFSAYADMALGLGRLFGFKLEENFKWPYAAESLHDFWRRWHIGLSQWFDEYCGAGMLRPMWGEIAVVLLCALWYGTAWGFFLWGAYHALLLALERSGVIPVPRLPWLLRHAYVVIVVSLGWVLLRTGTPMAALHFFDVMIGHAQPDRLRPLPVSLDVWAALIAGAIGSAPVARALRRWSVAIDAATMSCLMAVFATAVFIWRSVLFLVGRENVTRHLPGRH
jgi:alginate O-acetyltransferase complex protein AlgI